MILAAVLGLASPAVAKEYGVDVKVNPPTQNEDGTLSQNFGAENGVYRVVCEAEVDPHLRIQQSRCYADGSIFGEMDGRVDAVYLGRLRPVNQDPTIECLLGNEYDPGAECASFRTLGEAQALTANRSDISFSVAEVQKKFDDLSADLGFERAKTKLAVTY